MQSKAHGSLGRVVLVMLALCVPVVVGAHVTIQPRQSMQGATERYTVRIPSEGEVATVAAELEVPAGVIVEVLQTPVGWTYELKRAEDRIISIRWNVDVQPHEFLEVGFVARNPRQGSQIVWTLRQVFADGTVTDWTHGPDGLRPTAITALTARPQQ
ncbi:MAG TPA: DUF1775 domain-containing protein [Gammaproteobacteria bacterium]|nr:DUF1775 domain-containing protein [Gammaproteobacteria bacterium]